MGDHNLSSFILGMSPQDRKEYEIDSLAGNTPLLPIGINIMKRGESLAQLKDIKDLKWEKLKDNEIKGSFIYCKEKFFKIKCIFLGKKENKHWGITKLEIPRRKER